MAHPIALTIAGSDSGGGAGLQADLRTFHRFGVFGTTVVTAVTAQNTRRVAAWEPVSPALVRAQIDAVVADLRPAALKSGMLASAAVARLVADAIATHKLASYTLDPVLIATSGDALGDAGVATALRTFLVPLAELVTPNLDEATALLGRPVRDLAAMRDAARALVRDLGARAALVKGGHLAGDEVVDVFFDGETTEFRRPRVPGGDRHGTGCALSAAITAHRALGVPLGDAVARSLEWVHRAIASAVSVGGGAMTLNHWA